jgi:hypothetical protein
VVFFVIITLTISYVFNEKTSLIIPEETNKVVFGHSITEFSVNDSLINGLKNYCESGESYFYTFQKVKKVLETNENIDTVIIGLHPNQIEEQVDYWIWEDKYVTNRYVKFFPYFKMEDHYLIATKNFGGFLNAISLNLKHNGKRLLKRDFDVARDFGGFISNTGLVDSNNSNTKNPSEKIVEQRLSYYNLKYLKKIVDYCKALDKKVFFLNSPSLTVNDRFFTRYISEALNREFKGVVFLDFSKLRMDKKYFVDQIHMNYQGANMFSAHLDNLLKDGLLNVSKPNEMIENSNGELKDLE